MSSNPTDFDEYLVATVLADLFDITDSNDPDYLAQQIVKGLQENGLIKHVKDQDDELIAAWALS